MRKEALLKDDEVCDMKLVAHLSTKSNRSVMTARNLMQPIKESVQVENNRWCSSILPFAVDDSNTCIADRPMYSDDQKTIEYSDKSGYSSAKSTICPEKPCLTNQGPGYHRGYLLSL